MKSDSRKDHWENIYTTKQAHEVSWTQDNPHTSLDFIQNFNLPKEARIIDVGGGDSKLVDHLIDQGFEDITVLDISGNALERAKKRLGVKAKNVKWIEADILDFKPETTYDLWHDRAAFHFLTQEEQASNYLACAKQAIKPRGYLTIATFSEAGPKKCSGLEINQYSEQSLQDRLKENFQKIKCITEDHRTPMNTMQNFLFCSFKKKASKFL